LTDVPQQRHGEAHGTESAAEWPGANEVHLYSLSFDEHVAAAPRLLAWLSATEIKRAAAFRLDRLRERFVLAHGCVRAVLAGYLHQHPHDIVFGTNTHGKPLTMADSGAGGCLSFNLSHCDTHAVVAVAANMAIGVDIEQRRQGIDARGIAKRYFAPEESEAIDRLADQNVDSHFLLMWTCKEAFIKAIGLGLAYPLDRVLVRNAASGAPFLDPVEAEHGPSTAWSLRTWRPAPDRCIALAVKGPEPLTVRTFTVLSGFRIIGTRSMRNRDSFGCDGTFDRSGSAPGAPSRG
jgi:4'-phosphopantetheinyl transferase